MLSVSPLLFLILVIAASVEGEESQRITCDDLKSIQAIGTIFVKLFSSDENEVIDVKFYLSTRDYRKPVEIDFVDGTQLQSSQFDPSKRTYVIIHGYLSNAQRAWVLQMKDALLDNRDGNVIMVDWSDGSSQKNYVHAAKNTILASNRIFNLFQSLRLRVRELQGSSDEILWNHLHFIGHSLGAHVSSQTAHLLKTDSFWTIERITGLDPAKPCFTNMAANLRIDKTNADFVDVVHTNIGDGYVDALGLTETQGHIDFYFNGGALQPECQGSSLGYQEMICSHRLSCKYFIESIRNLKTDSCKFPVQRWDGSFLDAQIDISLISKGLTCQNCPNFGMDAVQSKMRGVFLVMPGSREPYCKFDAKRDIQKFIRGIMKLKGVKSIFDRTKLAEEEFPFPAH